MKTALFICFGIACLPAVRWMASWFLKRMGPSRHGPAVLFTVGGGFVLTGLVPAYLVISGAYSGIVPCAFKACLADYALASRPLAYYVSMGVWYCLGILLMAIGMAGIRKAIDAL